MQRNRDYYADFLAEEEELQASSREKDEEGAHVTGSSDPSSSGEPFMMPRLSASVGSLSGHKGLFGSLVKFEDLSKGRCVSKFASRINVCCTYFGRMLHLHLSLLVRTRVVYVMQISQILIALS